MANSVGLGKWYYDKVTRKRRYLSISGKNLVGTEAIEQSKHDRISKMHPSNSARFELHYLTSTQAPNSLEDIFNHAGPGLGDTYNNKSDIVNTFSIDPLDLASWGIPIRVVKSYNNIGINKMFPWQIDCLGVDDGKVLRGGIEDVYLPVHLLPRIV